MHQDSLNLPIAGFWRRIAALLIDFIILGLVGAIIGYLFSSQLSGQGSWTRIIGFLIAVAYFGCMNSKIGNGQTLGKRLLKIRVINANGESISIPKSILRFTILGLPFFMNGIVSSSAATDYWIYPLSLIIFGVAFSTTYLYIFNKHSRQSLHDLVAGTFVVSPESNPISLAHIWKPHLAVVSIIFIASVIAPAITSSFASKEPFKNLLLAQEELNKNPEIVSSSVFVTKSISKNEEVKFASANIFLKKNQITNNELAKRAAEQIKSKLPNEIHGGNFQIILIYGFDIGIASQRIFKSYQFKPEDLTSNS